MKETLQDILQLVNKVQNDDGSIKDAAKQLAKMKNFEEIAKIIKEECKLKENAIEKKMNMFFLMDEIILESKNVTTNFVVLFGHNLKEILALCCENSTNPQQLEDLHAIITNWEKQKIYASNFVEKLRKIISDKASFYGVNFKQEQSLKGNNTQDSKHNKAMIRDYKLIQENGITKQMYEIKMMEEVYLKKQEELNKMFVVEDIAMALKNKHEQGEFLKAKEKLEMSKRLANEIKDLLVKIVEEYCDCFKKCSKKCDLEMKEWTNFNFDNYEIYKQQIETLKDQSR